MKKWCSVLKIIWLKFLNQMIINLSIYCHNIMYKSITKSKNKRDQSQQENELSKVHKFGRNSLDYIMMKIR